MFIMLVAFCSFIVSFHQLMLAFQ